MPPLPCLGHSPLYDIALGYDNAPATHRTQAVHRAAALCASCPTPCDQAVTTETAPRELVLLDPDWLPPAREGVPEPVPQLSARRRSRPPRLAPTGRDYIPPARRPAAWARMAAEMAAADFPLPEIAAALCVDEITAATLLDAGRAAA